MPLNDIIVLLSLNKRLPYIYEENESVIQSRSTGVACTEASNPFPLDRILGAWVSRRRIIIVNCLWARDFRPPQAVENDIYRDMV